MKLFEDEGLGLGMESDLSATPGSGIGVAAEQDPAPVETAVFRPVVRKPSPVDARKEYMDSLDGTQRFGLALQEFGAGVQGKPSPIDQRLDGQRKERLAKTQELKEHVDALESGNKIARTLQGEAKANFVRDYTVQLNEMRPGLGDTFSNVAAQPGLLTEFTSYAQYLPESMRQLLRVNPDAFWKIAGTAEGLKLMEAAKDQKHVSVASRKAASTTTLLQQLPVPPEVQKAFTDNPSASTFKKVQDALPDGHAAKISEDQWAAINRDKSTQTLFYNSLNMPSPEEEAEVRKNASKDKGSVIEVGVGGGKFSKARTKTDGSLEMVGQPYEKREGTTITLGMPMAVLDTDKNSPTYNQHILVQPNKKGGPATPVPGVAPIPKTEKPNILRDILGGAGKAPAAAPGAKPAAAATPAPAAALPPDIASKLKAGVNTTLSDGSVWTVEGGKPKQVKPAVADRFGSDPAMKGNTLGPRSDLGFEVMDPEGNLIGHYA